MFKTYLVCCALVILLFPNSLCFAQQSNGLEELNVTEISFLDKPTRENHFCPTRYTTSTLQGGERTYDAIVNFADYHKVKKSLSTLEEYDFIGESLTEIFFGKRRITGEGAYIFSIRGSYAVDLDGVNPIDYVYVLAQNQTESHSYTTYFLIRHNDDVVLQQVGGTMLGLMQTEKKLFKNGGQEKLFTFNRTLKLDKEFVDFNNDGLGDYISHNTIYEDGNIDYFPTPYHWNGEMMTCASKSVQKYYDSITEFVGNSFP